MSVRRIVPSELLVRGALSLLVGVLIASTSAADRPAPASLIERATEAYAGAMESDDHDVRLDGFRRAELSFASAVATGVENADLYANLGNAALQADHRGQAVLAYRRALLLAPDLARARQNLAQIRTQLPDWVPTPPKGGVLDTFFFWHRTVSMGTRADLAAGFFFGAAALFAAALLLQQPLLRAAALLPFIGWAALVVSLAADPARDAANEGVVIGQDAVARSADSINAPSRFGEPLPAGTELLILEDRGGWMQVSLHNGRSAWLTSSQVERLRPSDES